MQVTTVTRSKQPVKFWLPKKQAWRGITFVFQAAPYRPQKNLRFRRRPPITWWHVPGVIRQREIAFTASCRDLLFWYYSRIIFDLLRRKHSSGSNWKIDFEGKNISPTSGVRTINSHIALCCLQINVCSSLRLCENVSDYITGQEYSRKMPFLRKIWRCWPVDRFQILHSLTHFGFWLGFSHRLRSYKTFVLPVKCRE